MQKGFYIYIIILIFLGILLFYIFGESREGFDNQNVSTTTTTTTSGNTEDSYLGNTPSNISYDNYNHYNKSATKLANGSVFYGENGGIIRVNQQEDGTQTLTITLKNGDTPVTYSSVEPNQNINSKVETYTNYYMQNKNGGSVNIFYGPLGNTATIFTDKNGQTAIRVKTSEGIYIFTSTNNTNNTITSNEYYGSTGSTINTGNASLSYTTGPEGNTAYYATGPNGNTFAGTTNTNTNTNPYKNSYYNNNVNGGAITGPDGNTAYYATGPNGNTVAGTNNYNSTSTYDYSNSLPPGIPKSMIPPGQEDLYILKTQVVPPVCPICMSGTNDEENKKCPPCPACARCPEPSITCKAVPNYNNINDQYLPQPVLNDFSTFGM